MGICEDIAAGRVAEVFAELVPDDSVDSANCPATAAALLAYVQSGENTPVPNASFVGRYNFTQVDWVQRTWAQIVQEVQESGQAVVVEATRTENVQNNSEVHTLEDGDQVTRRHYFVVFKCGSHVYVGDAFRASMLETASGVFLASNSADWRNQNEFHTYQRSRSFRVTPAARP